MSFRIERQRQRNLRYKVLTGVSLVVVILLVLAGQEELAIPFGLYFVWNLVLVFFSDPARQSLSRRDTGTGTPVLHRRWPR